MRFYVGKHLVSGLPSSLARAACIYIASMICQTGCNSPSICPTKLTKTCIEGLDGYTPRLKVATVYSKGWQGGWGASRGAAG